MQAQLSGKPVPQKRAARWLKNAPSDVLSAIVRESDRKDRHTLGGHCFDTLRGRFASNLQRLEIS